MSVPLYVAETHARRARSRGTPEEVTERLLELRRDMRFSTLSLRMNPGGQIPNERALKSMRLFAERVAPRLA